MPEVYTQAQVNALVAELQQQIAMLSSRCANHALLIAQLTEGLKAKPEK